MLATISITAITAALLLWAASLCFAALLQAQLVNFSWPGNLAWLGNFAPLGDFQVALIGPCPALGSLLQQLLLIFFGMNTVPEVLLTLTFLPRFMCTASCSLLAPLLFPC